MEGGGAIGGAGAGNARQPRRNRRYAERVGSSGGIFGCFMAYRAPQAERNDSFWTKEMKFAVCVFIIAFIAKIMGLLKFAIELTGIDIPDGYFKLGLFGKAKFHLSIVLCHIPLAVLVRWVVLPPLWRIATRFAGLITAVYRRYR